MQVDPALSAHHKTRSDEAKAAYAAGLEPAALSPRKLDAFAQLAETLRATRYLQNVPGALEQSGAHTSALRRMLAPPMSQDQFAILCSSYSKGREKSGSPIDPVKAAEVAKTFLAWRDKRLTRWLDEGRPPSRNEVRILMEAVALRIVDQKLLSDKRTSHADRQEQAVVDTLEKLGWNRKTSSLLEMPQDLAAGDFMRKTRCATTGAPREVDIACGLGKTIVAMECKVSNDATNSIKRIDDILQKERGWTSKWAGFIETAAMLQGVIEYKDVSRLLERDVLVFWSHRPEEFEAWIRKRRQGG